MPATPVFRRQRASRRLSIRRCEGRTPCKSAIIWNYPGARSVASDVSATAPLFCSQKISSRHAPGRQSSVSGNLPPTPRGARSRSAATACNAANAVSQPIDARFLSSTRAVNLAAKYADARAASHPNDGARNDHGCDLDEILDRKIAARLPRHRPRQIGAGIIPNNDDFTGSSAFAASG